MRTVFYVPPLRKMSGGLANIYETARDVRALGGEVALCGPDRSVPGLEEACGEGATLLSPGSRLSPSDLWCAPESWPSGLHAGTASGARVLVYVQSWIFMLKPLPGGVPWSRLPFSYIAVSRPVTEFLRRVHGISCRDVLPPAVDDVFFRDPERPGDRVRIAWMPRKNRALGESIRHIAGHMLAREASAPRVEWVEAHGLRREAVADIAATCRIFLSSGFPEGFGLAPLEAMASGCVPVGFTGFGGWEYMRQARIPGERVVEAPFAYAQGDGDIGNGFFFSDGDVYAAGLGLAKAVMLSAEQPELWAAISARCRETALGYTRAARLKQVERIFLSGRGRQEG
ncbi:MAG: glycosyltransferase family 1 protein [Desulfovibrio sp.]|jgi:glycosyltransferase involved in cell wall biosynthesis|nr:glycosyltransferase family 1 protein [Desulfovibrio sp.]